MEHNSQMQTILKRSAIIGSVVALLFSIYFSFDGLDQTIGGNDEYTPVAIVLGFGAAILFTIVEFIFNSGFGKLNMTLIVCGILAYVYSIRMNYLGIVHILHVTDTMSAVIFACAMDILPESMIAWALGESLRGDLFGNVVKSVGMVFGIQPKEPKEDQRRNNLRSPQQPADGFKRQNDQQNGQQHNQPKKGKGRSHWEQGRNNVPDHIRKGLENQVRQELSKPQRPLFDDDDNDTQPVIKF